MTVRYSVLERDVILSRFKSEQYDLLVIGGGITGAGIALDAASRGLKIALVEKNDFAFGTSSRSTKLIHGGLRYLKQLEFGLVKEVGSERAVVHNLAPHLVVPEKMLLPLYEKKGLGYWLTSIGLRVYDWLAGVKREDQRKMLTRLQTLRYEPLLKKDDVKGGAIYAEYRTDDARLTMEIVKTAVRFGADVLNYVKVNDFIYEQNIIRGVQVHDQLNNQVFTIAAQVTVSAAGPWVDELRQVNRSLQGKRLHLTKGVHVVVPHAKFPVRQAIYFDVEDGRMIFAIPRGRITYIGTTDTTYTGSVDRVTTSREDAEYLVRAVNATFPKADLKLSDLESSWAGLRPLIHEDGKSASELSRKDEIFESPTGLISIAGGKLTGYRKMAERVVNLVVKKHFPEKKLKSCHTQNLRLPGADFTGNKSIRNYTQKVFKRLKPLGFSFYMAKYLVENYGKQTDEILGQYETFAHESKPELALLKAELTFTVHHEMVATLQDFFVRRTGLLYFDIEKITRWKQDIADQLRQMLHWDDQKLEQELKALDVLVKEATEFNG
ncbi:MAG: glycerol-3-phosphate dehydrogenase/oxidase [Bacteroidota bacterium]